MEPHRPTGHPVVGGPNVLRPPFHPPRRPLAARRRHRRRPRRLRREHRLTRAGGEHPAAAKVKVFGAFATPIEEPWDGVIHQALQKLATEGVIDYKHADNIGYDGGMERTLREIATTDKPDIIIGDAFGNEAPVRAVAKDFPDIAFAFGSGEAEVAPNFSVFDNWIHDPAYLAGMLAGGTTRSNTVGVVGGMPVPEVNRIINAFIAGAQSTNPKVVVKVAFINSWFDPAKAKQAALAQVAAGADVLFAERAGVGHGQRHVDYGADRPGRHCGGPEEVLRGLEPQGLLVHEERWIGAHGPQHRRQGRHPGRPHRQDRRQDVGDHLDEARHDDLHHR